MASTADAQHRAVKMCLRQSATERNELPRSVVKVPWDAKERRLCTSDY